MLSRLKSIPPGKLIKPGIAVAFGGEVIYFLVTRQFRIDPRIYESFHIILFLPLILYSWKCRLETVAAPSGEYLREQTWNRISLFFFAAVISFFLAQIVQSRVVSIGFMQVNYLNRTFLFLILGNIFLIAANISLSPDDIGKKYPNIAGRKRLWLTVIVWPLIAYALWKAIDIGGVRMEIRRNMFFHVAFLTMMWFSSIWVLIAWRWLGVSAFTACSILFVSELETMRFATRSGSSLLEQAAWLLYYCSLFAVAGTSLIAVRRNFADRLRMEIYDILNRIYASAYFKKYLIFKKSVRHFFGF